MKSFPAFGILFGARDRVAELSALLEKNSGLPGQSANVALAQSFAASVAGMSLSEWQWEWLVATAGRSPNKAQANTAKEYPPFCALLALGALYGNGLPRPRRRAALSALKEAAEDPRWRIREGAAMALELIGERDAAALREIVTAWLPGASLFTLRAVVTGLAHPPLLADPEMARYSFDTARPVLAALSRADAKARGSESYKALRQGLANALSIFAAEIPAEGFALLRKAAAVRDPDVTWMIREALKKKRISGAFPKECAEVAAISEGEGAR